MFTWSILIYACITPCAANISSHNALTRQLDSDAGAPVSKATRTALNPCCPESAGFVLEIIVVQPVVVEFAVDLVHTCARRQKARKVLLTMW